MCISIQYIVCEILDCDILLLCSTNSYEDTILYIDSIVIQFVSLEGLLNYINIY